MFRASELRLALPDATCHGGNDAMVFSRAGIDSRKVQSEELFVAIVGEGRDGHDYVIAAIEAGATGVIVQCEVVGVPEGVLVVSVRDTRDALLRLGKYLRSSRAFKVVAVTGSAGKTSTKDLISHVVAQRAETLKSEASFNNALGVPLTLSLSSPDTQCAILELGANHPGEIAVLSAIATPDIAVITNIGYAHIEHFGGLDGTAHAKFEIVSGLSHDGVLIASGDDEHLAGHLSQYAKSGRRVVTVGRSAKCDIRIMSVSYEAERLRVGLLLRGVEFVASVSMFGTHFAYACGFAMAVAVELGWSPMDALESMLEFEVPHGRMRLQARVGGGILIDDSYNASPDAVLAGLDSLSLLPGRPHLAVLGEMRELGGFSDECHERVGRAAAVNASEMILVGGRGAQVALRAALAAGMPPESIQLVPGAREAMLVARDRVRALGDSCVVYVKGARFRHMERVLLGLMGSNVQCALHDCALYIHCSICPRLEVT